MRTPEPSLRRRSQRRGPRPHRVDDGEFIPFRLCSFGGGVQHDAEPQNRRCGRDRCESPGSACDWSCVAPLRCCETRHTSGSNGSACVTLQLSRRCSGRKRARESSGFLAVVWLRKNPESVSRRPSTMARPDQTSMYRGWCREARLTPGYGVGRVGRTEPHHRVTRSSEV